MLDCLGVEFVDEGLGKAANERLEGLVLVLPDFAARALDLRSLLDGVGVAAEQLVVVAQHLEAGCFFGCTYLCHRLGVGAQGLIDAGDVVEPAAFLEPPDRPGVLVGRPACVHVPVDFRPHLKSVPHLLCFFGDVARLLGVVVHGFCKLLQGLSSAHVLCLACDPCDVLADPCVGGLAYSFCVAFDKGGRGLNVLFGDALDV